MKPKEPIQTIEKMTADMQAAANLLKQIILLPMYAEIFKPGERGSIEHLFDTTTDRAAFTETLLEILKKN